MTDFDELHLWAWDIAGAVLCLLLPAMLWALVAL